MTTNNVTQEERLRQEQIAEARRLAHEEISAPRRILTVARSGDRSGRSANWPERKLTGHQTFLKALELSDADVVVEKISSGHVYYGKLRHSDQFTITVRVDAIATGGTDGQPERVPPIERVLFKHDISEFYTTTPPRPQQERVLPGAE